MRLPLTSTVGETSTLQALVERSKATVVVFWSSGCPCVARYQARIEALAQKYGPSGIAVLQVSSNAGETLASLSEAARARSLTLPIWRDEHGHVAQTLGARSTPTVVLLNADGTVLFRGYIDNERTPEEPGREAFLENALEGFLRGTPYASKSPTFGCTITKTLTPVSCHPPPVKGESVSQGVVP